MSDLKIAKKTIPFAAVLGLFTGLQAEEGMWPYTNIPKKMIEGKYRATLSNESLDHLRLASVRFNNGGSGSFISPNGLLFTNHHVGADCIQKVSTKQHNYMRDGFYASTQAAEKACPDLEVNVLLKMENVTGKVKGSVTAEMPTADANRARLKAISVIEKDCAATTGNRCDVVTLYAGGEYQLYQYKKYTDVRLVFAPEESIAAFGGDPDNFTYPRYCLDFSLFRAYQNGQPAKPARSLTWSKQGVKDGELAIVSGHPGNTGRMSTVAQMEFSRDVQFPYMLDRLKGEIQALEAYGAESAENKRVARDELASAQNSFKADTGFESGLRDPKLMEQKQQEEKQLRAAIAADPDKQKQYGELWDQIAAAYAEYAKFYMQRSALAPPSELSRKALTLLRYSEETKKPNGDRLREYADARLPPLEQQLYSPAPITNSLEVLLLKLGFEEMQQQFGNDDVTVKKVLRGTTPKEAAEYYVGHTKLKDVAERKRLAKDPEALKNSKDSMIELARLLDAPNRQLRKRYEDKVEAVVSSSAAKVAQARFAVMGADQYPDATFTLRLTYGQVRGYENTEGKHVPYATNFAGLYQRATGQDPFALPLSWNDAKPRLDLNTPFNFVSTCDIHGGNSGSPTVNAKGELIGIVFDSNLDALPNRYVYTEAQARAVHVASQGIVESLRKVYKTDRILQELGL